MLDDTIKKALEAPLNSSAVKQRTQAGFKLDYIEGWHAIAEANRIFGFDGWQRETIAMTMVRDPEIVQDKWRIGYMAKVKVTALGVSREGTGYGSGISRDQGDAIESAIKEAETDAMKRALMTFGNPFGLALYDKTRANVATTDEKIEHGAAEAAPNGRKTKQRSRELYERLQTDLKGCTSKGEITSLMNSDEMKADLATLPEDWETNLRQDAAELYRAYKAAETLNAG